MKNHTFQTLIASLIVLVLLLPAHAQERSGGVGVLMEEVTVTARKIEEGLQDTPIAVSAFSGESLDARGIQRVDDIASITPNMTFDNINVNGGSTNNAAVYIRGVGQRDFLPSADPGVGVYVDGVYMARSVGSVLDLIDVDRVEVLRGPQGTLFGRNTTGGAIAVHSKKPHEAFEGKVRVKVGTDNKLDVMGTVNGALSDNLFGNATIATFNQDGYIINQFNGQDNGNDNTDAFRGALLWQVSDDFEVHFTGDYSTESENGQPYVTTLDPVSAVTFIPPGAPGGGMDGNAPWVHNVTLGANSSFQAGIPFPLQHIPSLRQFNNCDATPANPAGTNSDCINASTIGLGQNNSQTPEFSDADVWGASMTIDWDFGDNLHLRSITAYRGVDSQFQTDGDNSPFFVSRVRDDIYEQEQISQEIQLLGTSFGGVLNWIVGGFYFTEDGNNFNPVDFTAVDIESGGKFDHESKAVFAQGTFDLTDQLHLTAGIRYTEDTKDFIVDPGIQTVVPILAPPSCPPSTPPFCGPPGPVVLIDPGTTTLDADDWTPMANIAYDWNDEVMTYFTYSEGFKSGGVQQRNAGRFGASAPTYDPEFVESFEVGLKYNSADGRFVLNAAAFTGDYTNIQLNTLAPEGIAPQLDNAGTGEIKGVEIESRWAPMDDLFFELAIGHLDATITAADPSVTNSGGPAAGDRLPQIPDWTLAASGIKEFSLGDMGSLTTRIDYNYRGKVFFEPDNEPTNIMKAHGVLNASAAWNSADDRFGLTFHANNITDKRIKLYSADSGSAGVRNVILARDFAWYLTGEYRF